MAIRIQNEKDPLKALYLAASAWQGILELALDHGWNPMGASLPGSYIPLVWGPLDPLDTYYPPGDQGFGAAGGNGWNRLVVLDDALNLADALQRAFLRSEPVRVPATYFLFEPEDLALRLRPGIGALLAVMDLSYHGAFWIEHHPWPPGRDLP